MGLSLAEKVTLEECTDEEDVCVEKRDNIQDLEDRITRRRTAGERGEIKVGTRGEKMRQAKVSDYINVSENSKSTIPNFKEKSEQRSESTDFEIFYDWDKIVMERSSRLRREESERRDRVQRAEAQSKSWKLMRICKEIIREHTPEWQENLVRQEKRRVDMNREEEREIRKEKAGEKKKIYREKYVQTKLNLILSNGDEKIKEEWRKYMEYDEQEREMRLDMAEAKDNLWRWRSEKKKKGGEEKVRKKYNIDKGELLDRRIVKLDEIIAKCEKEKAGERGATEDKLSKDEARKKRLEAKRQQEEKWGMIRWLGDFMDLNQEIMSENPGKGEEIQTLKEWEKMKRLEKIK